VSLPPKVVHIIYALGTGGLENGLVNIINRTPADRYRHVIICLTDATDFAKRITAPDVEVIQLHKKPGQDWGLYFRLLKTLFSLRPDIVHTRNLASLEMQALTLLLPGVKRVHGEHGRDIYDLDGTNKKYNALRKVLRLFIHQYIAVSKDLESWLRDTINVPQQKLRQIYNGVDSEKFHPGTLDAKNALRGQITPPGFLPDNSIVVGSVGRIAEVKNHKLLVDGVKSLIDNRPELKNNLRLVLVGGGPLSESLQAHIAEQGLSDLVWMAGDRNDIPQLMQLMDIFVLPSLAEGISNTVLEAMATKLPVIATNVGGNPELISEGENGCLVTVGDVEGLATAIGELVDHSDDRTLMGQNGLNRVSSTFNWPKTVNEYLNVYDDLLDISQRAQ
tara:strand:+ start:63382 stop:64551 length:1170 start_codon:yes stop_codon:yes gene_type:complete